MLARTVTTAVLLTVAASPSAYARSEPKSILLPTVSNRPRLSVAEKTPVCIHSSTLMDPSSPRASRSLTRGTESNG
jgi:hypothetical protein